MVETISTIRFPQTTNSSNNDMQSIPGLMYIIIIQFPRIWGMVYYTYFKIIHKSIHIQFCRAHMKAEL